MRRTAALHGFAAAPERTWQRRLVAIVGGLALALTGLIAWQIRLAAQVEKAAGLRGLERARLGLERVAEEVQDELDRLRLTFGVYAESDTLGIGLAVRRGKWRAGAIRPELLTAVCVVREMNEVRPRCLDAEGYLRPGPWPASLRLWAGRNPSHPSRAAAPVLFISKMPFGLEPPDRSGAPELRRFDRPQERILLGLNRTLLTDTLPRLLLWRHLDVDTQSRVTVYVRPAGQGDRERAIPYVLSGTFSDGVAVIAHASSKAPIGPGSFELQLARRGTKSWPEQARGRVPAFWMEAHPTRNVQAATARAHRASMALSGAAGLLVFGLLGLLYVSARRAHALAQDRMAIAAAVSHELRTPVAAILTVAENLRDGVVSAPEQVAAYGAVLAGEAQRLRRTVEHTLALTRPSGGVFECVDLVDVAKTAVARVQAQHPEALLHLDVPAPTFVVADADALEGALVNLIENAVKYGAGRPVDISVRSAQGRVEIRIEDRGIGLAEGEAARVFEPFYRGAEARRVAPGIGLGLPLVRRVAEVHGGRVQAAAREGGGARFTVSLPRSETRGRTREPVFDHKVNPSG